MWFHRRSTLLLTLGLGLQFVACGAPVIRDSGPDEVAECDTPPCDPADAGSSSDAGMPVVLGKGIQKATLAVEPEAGATPILQAIDSAKTSIRLQIYLLTHYSVVAALKDAVARGVDVRVMLEPDPVGDDTDPAVTVSALEKAGIQVKETNPAFRLTHSKMLIIDQSSVLLSTANYTKSGLGGSSAVANREFTVTDTEPADVAECTAIFDADWNRTTPTLSSQNLIVSPVNARSRLLALIGSATSTLHVEQELMRDYGFIDALTAAQKRGVEVTVILPEPKTAGQDLEGKLRLKQGGVRVLVVKTSSGHPFIHAKVIVADGRLAFVGSQNASNTSLDMNREVGVLVANASVVQKIETVFNHDVSIAQAFE